MVLLIVDIITDTVEVIQFSPDKNDTTTLVTNLIYTWVACVASSWIIFLFEVYITLYSFIPENLARDKVIDRMKTAHLTLVMISEDILLC